MPTRRTFHSRTPSHASHACVPALSHRRGLAVVAAAGPPVMVNSCTGKMGHATAEAVLRAGLELIPYTFCGVSQGVAVGSVGVSGVPVERVTLDKRDQVRGNPVTMKCGKHARASGKCHSLLCTMVAKCVVERPYPLFQARQRLSTPMTEVQVMQDVKAQYPELIIIDYTLPTAVNGNGEFYAKHRVPFVMGTTGGDRDALLRGTRDAGLFAVIAPQMGKQVVAFQAMMQTIAEQFPGAFSGYKLEVVESHQRTKADTSGTAKAVVESLRQLGVQEFAQGDIQRVRDPQAQVEDMHVPRDHLDGHAFHTYRLRSPDGSVGFEFQHNVCGRTIYAEGTVDAALFLHERIRAGGAPQVYDMVDVLRAGSMR